ncbi:unnamed protein product [Cyprideis torosa]|uniref:adenosine deaminase n=1 Tax=Cyprideis torosa TaxID=163714 RepID=A0A7R8W3A1_9CRUS|nr:unnamed protein product [Cyprideis torosa]CAG0882784.1 unnamed protein product [Cyprideis torosa]
MPNPPITAAVLPRGKCIDPNKIPKTRVELHCHLDGSVRHETLWELLKIKKKPLPGNGTFRSFEEALVIDQPVNLDFFLSKFMFFVHAIEGDVAAMERVAYEFTEDAALSGLLYFETRTSPHFLWPSAIHNNADKAERMDHLRRGIRAILRGLLRGEKEFGIKGRLILSCIRLFPGWSMDVVELCDEFRHQGVVGIDVAGVERLPCGATNWWDSEIKLAFQRAKELGIHRTVHAGEDGPGLNIEMSLNHLYAERIGHGYNVLDDAEIYERVRRERVHLECCPYSSILTGSVSRTVSKHPIVRFAEDNVNFSINRDDTTLTFSTIQDEYNLVQEWGLTEAHIVKANWNALEASFLPEEEKACLRKRLERALKPACPKCHEEDKTF